MVIKANHCAQQSLLNNLIAHPFVVRKHGTTYDVSNAEREHPAGMCLKPGLGSL